jgi:hypothetical protein
MFFRVQERHLAGVSSSSRCSHQDVRVAEHAALKLSTEVLFEGEPRRGGFRLMGHSPPTISVAVTAPTDS